VSLRCDCRRTEAGRAVVELSVVDTGCGFDAEFAKRMFEPFVQADSTNTRRYGGTGLGLAICRELVELMGGQIGAEAVSPHGAKFTLRLELRLASEAADPVLADSARRARALADVGKRVLVAEDHPLNRLVMGVLLDELGVAHEMVEHGAAAVEAVTRDDFDAVLMDLQMPIMDGLEATRAIRRLPGGRGQVPIIAVTADVMSDHVEGCMTAGMNDFLAKPVQPHALQQVLFKYLSDDEGRRVAS
jgi:CheY-like chemotaxis protein